ncbi:MAG TPA: hypothetical protein VGL13_15865 [Polyangiaceae bacterium]|jgi:hypothetical protein
MNQEQLSAILDLLSAKVDKEGWSTFPDGRGLTLYVAHGGVQLTVGRIEAVIAKQGLLRARTAKGEIYLLGLDDVFAASVEATPTQARRPGFS